MVTVVALLVILHHAIAAGRRLTAVARIGWIIITIVTPLAWTDKPIAAAGAHAVIEAAVRVADVAIVTSFILIENAVTAWSRLTSMTAVRRVLVVVVTTFSRSNKTVAADRSNTRGETPVGLKIVAIITGFSSFVAGLQIQTTHAVAAARNLAVISTRVCVVLVGVVTTLKAGRALGEISAHDAVTTGGDDAV